MRPSRKIDLDIQAAYEEGSLEKYITALRARFKTSPFDLYRLRLMRRIFGNEPKGSVLEIGCNAGIMAQAYERAASKIILSDYELFFVKGAAVINKRFSNKIVFSVNDAKRLPFKDKTFDTISALELIEHVPLEAHAAVLEEIRRVSKNNAAIYLSTPNARSIPGFEGRILEAFVRGYKWNAWNDAHKYIYTAKLFKDFLNDRGFVIKRIYGYYFLPGSLMVRLPAKLQLFAGYISYLFSRYLGRFEPFRSTGFTTIVHAEKQ